MDFSLPQIFSKNYKLIKFPVKFINISVLTAPGKMRHILNLYENINSTAEITRTVLQQFCQKRYFSQYPLSEFWRT